MQSNGNNSSIIVKTSTDKEVSNKNQIDKSIVDK